MQEPTELEINEYLDYLTSHIIIISDYIKNNNINKKNIINQHLDEMGESLISVLNIINNNGHSSNDIYEGIDNSTIKIIRDFKISKIMDEINK
jgi:hypothetical protein